MDQKNESFICKDNDGNVLISIEPTDEKKLDTDPLLTHCLAVVKIGNDYLFGMNKWRERYEIFGGCIEKGETARDCIIREIREELGAKPAEITYLGTMNLLLRPDYFSKNERIEHGGLYGIRLEELSVEDIYSKIEDKEEIVRLALYSQIKNKERIAQIDEKLLKFYP